MTAAFIRTFAARPEEMVFWLIGVLFALVLGMAIYLGAIEHAGEHCIATRQVTETRLMSFDGGKSIMPYSDTYEACDTWERD